MKIQNKPVILNYLNHSLNELIERQIYIKSKLKKNHNYLEAPAFHSEKYSNSSKIEFLLVIKKCVINNSILEKENLYSFQDLFSKQSWYRLFSYKELINWILEIFSAVKLLSTSSDDKDILNKEFFHTDFQDFFFNIKPINIKNIRNLKYLIPAKIKSYTADLELAIQNNDEKSILAFENRIIALKELL